MQFGHFLLAIFAGRFIRFLILATLTLKFGPQIVQIFGNLFRAHWALVLAAVGVGLATWLVVWRMQKRSR
jgi:membrane protein DedA with SNARE-associated domain